METRDKILEIIKLKGPVLPFQISKEIGSNILMASAHLAELTASNKLKTSTIKVGGSPLYYLPGQEAMLQGYTANMNDKEKKAFDLLSQNKILRDSEQEPVIRVALREIKDFAVPLNVNYNNNVERFWKWYLTSNEEAEKLIKSKLEIIEKPIEKKFEEKLSEKIQEIKQQKIEEKLPIQKQLKEKKEPRKYKEREKEDHFLNNIIKFFEKNKISVISSEIIKKNLEMDFVVEIPSVVGNLQYYCKAKNKKRINDSDLSSAYVKGQFKKLPVLMISTGDLSAKAQEMLTKELNNITFKKV
ncbi:hypothetical protein HYX00_05620 [Candidatus Woesearchaeota archaeon]|nr:hypothetical protein [Candidatus Woesearchaeota archaeon]